MEHYSTVADLRAVLDGARSEGRSVGMVGTSGAMHEGHLSLIRRSVVDNDITLLYWGGAAAFEWMTSQIDYARDAKRDFALAEQAGCDLVFSPANHEFFPRKPMTVVSLPAMSSAVPHLEDPSHLDLIAMVMCRMWNMVGPCRNYYGEKDWQQLAMYKRMADDLFYPVEVIGCPTVREPDGLAVSSRNAQLTEPQRAESPILYLALAECLEAMRSGIRSAAQLEEEFAGKIGDSQRIRYFSAVDADTVSPQEELRGSVRLLASIQVGSVRLLDNVGLTFPD